MAVTLFGELSEALSDGGYNFASGSFEAVLIRIGSTWVAQKDTIEFVGDATTPNFADGTTHVWTYGGTGRKSVALTPGAQVAGVTKTTGPGTTVWTAVNANTSTAIEGVLLYKAITNDAASPVLAYFPFASTITANGGNITVTWNATAVFTLSTT